MCSDERETRTDAKVSTALTKSPAHQSDQASGGARESNSSYFIIEYGARFFAALLRSAYQIPNGSRFIASGVSCEFIAAVQKQCCDSMNRQHNARYRHNPEDGFGRFGRTENCTNQRHRDQRNSSEQCAERMVATSVGRMNEISRHRRLPLRVDRGVFDSLQFRCDLEHTAIVGERNNKQKSAHQNKTVSVQDTA